MINVKAIVAERKQKIKDFVSNYKTPIKLAIIQVGDNPASNSYIKGKLKDCEEVGMEGILFKYDEDIPPIVILHLIKDLNIKYNYKGIIVQLPLPPQFTQQWQDRIFNAIAPEKDVDGFRADTMFTPCTPKGVVTILDKVLWDREGDSNNPNANLYNGKVACVIGRSEIVGKPMAKLLIEKGCTVISCNSHTKDLDRWLQQSDIIISAVGKPYFLSTDNFVNWEDKIIIDVGINHNAEGKLCGDCSGSLQDKTDYITPVPGGVGLSTRLSLLENIVQGIKFYDLSIRKTW